MAESESVKQVFLVVFIINCSFNTSEIGRFQGIRKFKERTNCQAGDASGIKDLVASTIEGADDADRELEEKVDDQVRQQANEYGLNGDGYDNEQVVENKDESKPQSNQLPSGVIDINAIDN